MSDQTQTLVAENLGNIQSKIIAAAQAYSGKTGIVNPVTGQIARQTISPCQTISRQYMVGSGLQFHHMSSVYRQSLSHPPVA